MQRLTMQQLADYLETATIEGTTDHGHAITHTGTNEAGARFVLVNDINGDTTLTEAP